MAPKDSGEEEETATVRIENEIWLKPPDAWCMMQWEKGRSQVFTPEVTCQ